MVRRTYRRVSMPWVVQWFGGLGLRNLGNPGKASVRVLRGSGAGGERQDRGGDGGRAVDGGQMSGAGDHRGRGGSDADRGLAGGVLVVGGVVGAEDHGFGQGEYGEVGDPGGG